MFGRSRRRGPKEPIESRFGRMSGAAPAKVGARKTHSIRIRGHAFVMLASLFLKDLHSKHSHLIPNVY